MAEGEQIPEKRPLTPTEKSDLFIKSCASKIRTIGIYSYFSGVNLMLTVNNINNSNKWGALMTGLASALSLVIPLTEGVRLKRGITRLSEESAKLIENPNLNENK